MDVCGHIAVRHADATAVDVDEEVEEVCASVVDEVRADERVGMLAYSSGPSVRTELLPVECAGEILRTLDSSLLDLLPTCRGGLYAALVSLLILLFNI